MVKREGIFSNYCHERPHHHHHHYYIHFHCHHRHHALAFLCLSVRKMFGFGEEMQILLVLTSTKMVLMVPVLKMQILPMLTKGRLRISCLHRVTRPLFATHRAPALLSILDAQSPLLSIHPDCFWVGFALFMRPRSDNLGLLSLLPL